MSVEGMWAIYFGDVAGGQVNSGIIVLETERLFGGDSLMAYRGNYTVSNGHVQGTGQVWAYNPTVQAITAFGQPNPEPQEVRLEGDLQPESDPLVIEGLIWRTSAPGIQLPARLVKICDLP